MEETEDNQEIFGRIYKISSSKCDGCYIGSTTKTLARRFAKHVINYRSYLRGKQNYISSFEIVKHDDAKIELLHEGVFPTRFDLLCAENRFIEGEPSAVNRKGAGLTRQESRRKSYMKNKPNECRRCVCNLCHGSYTLANKWNHERGKKHQAAAQINNVTP